MGGQWGGGGCNRSPLIISNTAVAQRLKTKAQLRKELWGWSKPPPLCAEMEDEKTLDSDCICDFSPLNLHPASVSPAGASSFFFFAILFSLLLLYHPSASSPFVSLSAELLRKCATCNLDFRLRWFSNSSPATLTYNQKRRTVGNFTVSSLPIKMDCCVTLTVHTLLGKKNKLLITPKHTNQSHPTSITARHSNRAVFSVTRQETSEENDGWLRSRQAVVLAPPPCAFISPS